MSERIKIINCRIFDTANGGYRPETALYIKNGLIRELFCDNEAGSFDGIAIDGGGNTVLPGLIDAHVHVCMNGTRTALQDYLSANEVQVLQTGLDSLKQTVERGVTTVRDMACPGEVVSLLKQEIGRDPFRYPHFVASGPAITRPRGHGYYFGLEVTERETLNRAVKSIANQFDLVKVMGSGGRLTESTNPQALQFSEAELRDIVDLAHQYEKTVAVHVHPQPGVAAAVAAGVDSIEHGSYATALDVASMAERGTYFVPTLSPARFLFDALKEQDIVEERVEARKAAVRFAIEAGTRMVAGTDSGVPFVPHGSVAEEVLCLAEQGLSAAAAIRSATVDAAALLGLGTQVGQVAPGYQADLILVRGSVLEDLTVLRSPNLVMRSGCIVADRQKVPGEK